MCEAFQITVADRPAQVALRTIGGGVSITFGEYGERVKRLAAGLHGLGVRRGDTVAFLTTNRPEFHLLDAAAMHLGATPFSVYNTASAEQIAYVLGDAGNRVLVVDLAFRERALEAAAAVGGMEHMVVLDASSGDLGPGELSLSDLESFGPVEGFAFEAVWRAVQPDDVLTLIYTSGTTGPPKGSTRPRPGRDSAAPRSRSCRWPTSPTAASATTRRCTSATRSRACPTRCRCSPPWPTRARPGSGRSQECGRS
jgi:long-subunit acyl-CoA synthetase (AMP-forming)